MAAEHTNAGMIAGLLDGLWGLVLLAVSAVGAWVFGHERRMTTLEAQHKECASARERNDKAMDGLQHKLDSVSSKLDRILGRLGGRDDGGQ